jgi:hypothetical protein
MCPKIHEKHAKKNRPQIHIFCAFKNRPQIHEKHAKENRPQMHKIFNLTHIGFHQSKYELFLKSSHW